MPNNVGKKIIVNGNLTEAHSVIIALAKALKISHKSAQKVYESSDSIEFKRSVLKNESTTV